MSERFFKSDAGGTISRRDLLMAVPALMLAPRVRAQGARSGAPVLRVKAFNHMTLSVSDPKRSLEFYQGLFGMPIQARQGMTNVLRIGAGPQFVAIGAAGANPPSINHLCLTIEDFNLERVLKTLADHGVTKVDQALPGSQGGGPLKVRVRMRGPEAGGATAGTPEVYMADPDGLVVQLQDPRYCGGAGALGEVCGSPEPSPTRGLLAVRDISHFTLYVTDARRSNAFYQSLFGMGIRSHQGPTAPTLAIGDGVEFLMLSAGGAAASGPPRAASINHACLNLEKFDVDRILKTLESFGIKPRGTATGPVGPMTSYVSMRMENRGGAKEGTPELYFTDPDGILIQLQDVSYCGGGGYLGNLCPS